MKRPLDYEQNKLNIEMLLTDFIKKRSSLIYIFEKTNKTKTKTKTKTTTKTKQNVNLPNNFKTYTKVYLIIDLIKKVTATPCAFNYLH
jgi:predicted protein tyrosine phosphatase